MRPRTPTRPPPRSATSIASMHGVHHQSRQRGRSSAEATSSSEGAGRVLLVDLIEQQLFHEAVDRAREYPSEAAMNISGEYSSNGAHNSIMGQGNLALHEACKNQPPIELIDALLEANESAVHTKGQWGYLPLHFACCSRASPEVVAKLIIAYPSATRTKDDHEGFLPLHLASKWGADDEVIMALLTVHPKASSVRDLSGKTPIEHASALSSPHVREAVVNALHRAPILCAVSKAAMNKLAYENDAKLREVVEVYQERMAEVKERYEADKTHTVALEVQLRKELWDEKERSAHLSEKVALLERQLAEKERETEEREQIFVEVQDLISGKRKTKPQVEAMKQQKESKRREKEEEEKERLHQQIAKNALREWVSAGNVSPGEQSGNDDAEDELGGDDERREPPPTTSTSRAKSPNPSPRSAAISTVKEWFSSETNDDDFDDDVRQVPEDRRRYSTQGNNSRSAITQGDRVEQYRVPANRKQNQTPTSNTPPSSRNSKNVATEKQSNKGKGSLLSRSKSAARSRAVMARREYHQKSSNNNNDNQDATIQTIHLQQSRSKTPGRDRPLSRRPQQQQQQRQPKYPSSQNAANYEERNNDSGSSGYTPKTQHGNSAPPHSPSRYNYTHGKSSRSHSSSTSRRPRETYSTTRAQTSAYSHRITDDTNETMDETLDSNIDWE